MPKGKMTGIPTNIVCWLVGGRYNETVWGISYNRSNLLDEIEMHYYDNPRAKSQGVTILGITKAAPDDVLVTETYRLMYVQETAPAFAVYTEIDSEEDMILDSDDPKERQAWIDNFKKLKGYDLPVEHLDPKNMPGEIRKVDV